MSPLSDLLKAINEMLSLIQASPMLLLGVITICAFGVVAMALRVAHAALEKRK